MRPGPCQESAGGCGSQEECWWADGLCTHGEASRAGVRKCAWRPGHTFLSSVRPAPWWVPLTLCFLSSASSQGSGSCSSFRVLSWTLSWFTYIRWLFNVYIFLYHSFILLWNNFVSISFQFSRSVMSNSLRPHGLWHTRPPCPSWTPRVCSNSCPLNQWCHPAISSSVVPFSSCPQSFPASGSFQMSQLFASGDQSIGVSASASVLPMSISGLISFRIDWLDLLAVQGPQE